ncbi:BamA/TamA family outer membrane protein [Flexithrix dorotheae]|uniref:BamA/TamA family outer membrane protein n=1 Tax=Flexithrix dorotheae TaxID=70993 RepID=UPI0003782B83|nr:BamA/TamA family outer membrane protein [Flexithrix dorotheae]
MIDWISVSVNNQNFIIAKKCGRFLSLLAISIFQFSHLFALELNHPSAPEFSGTKDSLIVNEIVIIGNKVTKKHIILRELDFNVGSKISEENISQFFELEENKLRNTNLFITQEIDYYEAGTASNEIVVQISLKERWYTFPIPIISLADRSFNEWWQNQNHDLSRLNYGINFKRKNFRGRKEDLGILFQFGFTKRVRLIYRVPYLNKAQNLGITTRISYAENKNMAYNTINNKLTNVDGDGRVMRTRFDAGISLTKRDGFYNFHTFGLRFFNNSIADTVAQLNPDYFLDSVRYQKFFELSYSFTKDFRDFAAYPRKGHYFSVEAYKLGLGLWDDVDIFGVAGIYSKYMDLGSNFFYSLSASGKLSFPEKQPYNLFKALGYNQNFVRGYDLYVVDGYHYGLIKNTMRWKLFDKEINAKNVIPIDQFNTIPLAIYLKGYFDAGRVRNNNVEIFNERLTNKPIYGYGLGLDIVTFYNAVYRFEYSFNNNGESGFYLYFKADI